VRMSRENLGKNGNPATWPTRCGWGSLAALVARRRGSALLTDLTHRTGAWGTTEPSDRSILILSVDSGIYNTDFLMGTITLL